MVRKILIPLAYIAVIIAVLATTALLVAIGQGYSYDFKTHKFVNQTGLLVISSSPQGGGIYINGNSIKRNTPYRSTFDAGDYDIEIRRDGYQNWHKKVTIKPSEVTTVQYPLLIPKDIKTEAVTTGQAVTSLVASDDHRHFAYLTTGTTAGVWLLNTDRRQSLKVYQPRTAIGDQPAETVTNVSWSKDASHLLVQTAIGPTAHYVVVPASGGTAVDLTELFKFDLAGLQFSPSDWRDLYWLSPEGLRLVNVEARTVSAVLADKVTSFAFAGDRLLYVQTIPTGKSVWAADRLGRDPKRLIESLSETDSYDLKYANYRGKEWLAVLAQKAGVVTIYGDIFSATPVAKIVSKSAAHISFSEEGRYLAFYNADGFGTYDTDKATLALRAYEPGTLTSLAWFDNFHVTLNLSGTAQLAEFDGANAIAVTSAATGTAVFGTNDLRQILALSPVSAADSSLRLTMSDVKN